VCVCVCVCVFVYVCVYVKSELLVLLQGVLIYTCSSIILIYTYIYVCICVYIDINVHTHMYIYIHIYTYSSSIHIPLLPWGVRCSEKRRRTWSSMPRALFHIVHMKCYVCIPLSHYSHGFDLQRVEMLRKLFDAMCMFLMLLIRLVMCV